MFVFVKFYHFYRTALVRSIRLIVFMLLLALILFQISHDSTPKFAVFLFNIVVMIEVFFHYKISRVIPTKEVAKNKKETMYDSFTMQALYGFVTEPDTAGVIKRLIKYPQVKLIMEKANITNKELVFSDISKDILADSAFETAQTFKGKFVTTLDVFIAYLFLIEKDTKLFFAKQLKTADIYNIMYWVRQTMPEEENPKPWRVNFTGEGVGEALVTGWTPETKKYTVQFTNYALRDEPLIGGREKEFGTMLEALTKVENNNVLLVGDIGAGKENLVKALAYHSFEGNLGGWLNYKKVLQLLVGALTAGAGNRSDLEARLQDVIAEVSHAENVILYIPDFQNILGASSYGLDLSGALLPYLKGGGMPMIATMSTGAYKTYMEKNPLKEVFEVISLAEPEQDNAIQMVLGEAAKIEKKYSVILSYRSIISAVELSERFFQDEVLPGSAVALLEDVANIVSRMPDRKAYERTRHKMVLEEDVVKKVEETSHIAIALPSGNEIQVLLHLEDKLHERVIAQDDAVKAVSEAMRRLRSGMSTSERPISFLFLGPTGVGKTETAKSLADFYYGGEKNMIRLDMSEYTDENGLKRLLGAPPGEGNERGELTDKVHDNPAALILLDEFEKANPKIHNLFLQVFDDGRLTDNKGNTVSFRNAIIIATSNAGSEFIREQMEKGTKIDSKFQHQLLDQLQTQGIFKPELLNRFDDVVIFKPLGSEQVTQVVNLMLEQLKKDMDKQDIKVYFDDAVVAKIAQEGFDKDFGARPLRRYIQDTIEDIIAQKKLTKEITRGKTVTFSLDGTGAMHTSIV
ncbi:MAG TPA: ATP-dependent Clp protease ATP-binding subunit [Candidatus Saccharimonadales bacterium]|nr:ATP-dependent Clp protease ATP-binding subunit [Candidatus Saccharimonadales bacterium]